MQNSSDVLSLCWFKDDGETGELRSGEMKNDEEQPIIEQFVQNVEDFSSQYGSEISVSYTAFNLRGPPSNFPDYGDYPQAFVMRTYGTWWDEAPSAQKDYMPQNTSAIASQDFVEVSFEKAVFPLEVSVFETYNPGALVRIWAKGPTSWMLLWEGEPQYVGDTPRIFSPPIRKINVLTRILRLEFNHKLLPYYTELDAVLLRGKQPNCTEEKGTFRYPSFFFKTPPVIEKGQLLNKIIASNLHESIVSRKQIDTGPSCGDFQRLPDETILCVMKYLDIQSLCRCAQVNKLFNRLASDSILYRCIDLRPYWHCVHSQVLVTLSMRCKYLQKLDLSWCGSHRMIQPNYVVNFLRDNGSELTHLRLNCCKFVDNSVLRAIVDSCTYLQAKAAIFLSLQQITNKISNLLKASICHETIVKQHNIETSLDVTGKRGEIDLRVSRGREAGAGGVPARMSVTPRIPITPKGELCLRSVVSCTEWIRLASLKRLKRLDLYRTDISTLAAVTIVRSNPLLEHLNVGSCKMISAMDEVAIALGANCPNLISVDFWKSYSLTPNGIRALADCKQLQELDVGWCLQAGGSGEWLAWLEGSELRKLFLGALRGVCDRDLRALLPRAPKLTQLDLLGVRAVTPDICDTILAECKELRLLDVSFCDQIQESQVLDWREQYPHVSIKRSFQSANLGASPSHLFFAPSLE